MSNHCSNCGQLDPGEKCEQCRVTRLKAYIWNGATEELLKLHGVGTLVKIEKPVSNNFVECEIVIKR